MMFVCELSFGDQRHQGLIALYSDAKADSWGLLEGAEPDCVLPHPPEEMLSGGLLNWWRLTYCIAWCLVYLVNHLDG